MNIVREKFGKFLRQFNFNRPKIEVISNVEARPYTQEKVTYLLESQINNTVL